MPEPAASVKVNNASFEFVGDLQELYGGENGYPQAVLVAKSAFVSENAEWVSDFLSGLDDAAQWLFEADAATIVNAVSAHLTEGLTPKLNTANLSRTAIEHSGVWFTGAAEGKEEVNAFLDKLIAVSETAASKVSDAFYYQP